MGSIPPFMPILAIVGVAVLTFLYTVAKEIESKVGVIELRDEVKRLQDQFARRRAAVESGTSAQVLQLADELDGVEVLDAGLGGGGGEIAPAQAA
ncbi:MAG: hypothetical protein KDA20_01040 [Phycisphaerales bacterium]|nr:hypothetical protein [Phycisphaerales bacterium]